MKKILSARLRNAACIVGVGALTAGLLATAQGCGGETQAVGGAGSTGVEPAAAATTPTTPVAAPQTATVQTVAADCPAPGGGQQTATDHNLQILSMNVSPDPATYNQMITFTVEVKGEATRIMAMYGAAGGDIATPHMVSAMQPGPTSGGVTTWTTTVPAPKGFPQGNGTGLCFYKAIGLATDGYQVELSDDANMTFTVSQ